MQALVAPLPHSEPRFRTSAALGHGVDESGPGWPIHASTFIATLETEEKARATCKRKLCAQAEPDLQTIRPFAEPPQHPWQQRELNAQIP